MLELLHEDAGMWVYNKPTGTSVLKDRSGQTCLWDELIEMPNKPYLVHRLDKGTSGCLLVAKNQATQSRLTKAFAQRQVGKFYVAVVAGRFPQGGTIIINLPLCRGRKSRYRVAGLRESIHRTANTFTAEQDRDGYDATTRARTLAPSGGTSVVVLQPLTGRTHQLRVHLSWLGFPIIGDHLYGRPDNPEQRHDRLMLHCHKLVIPGVLRITAPLPTQIADRLARTAL